MLKFKRKAAPTPPPSDRFLGTLEEQDAQIEQIKEAELKYKEDGDLESIVAFWNRLWANGGLVFNGTAMHFRAVDLNMKIGDNDSAWRILNQIMLRHPDYDTNVYKYRYKIMKREGRYMGALEHLVDRYSVDVGFDREHFLKEAKSTIRKVDTPANIGIDEIADGLAKIGENEQNVGDIHDALGEYYNEIGWLK